MSAPASPAAAPSAARGLHGILAEFDSVEPLLAATERVRDAGFTRFDVHAPIPIHGLDEAMGIRMSWLPWLVACGGATGAVTGLLLQWWTNGVDYPFLISGKPFFGLPAAVPIIFELAVLFASIAAVAGLFAVNGWPRLHHPLFSSEKFRDATAHRFFISIEAVDPRFDREATKALLRSLGAVGVEEVED